MGFGCMLDFTCTSNVNDIFLWLVKQLDPETTTVTLENGFSFTLSPCFAKKIFGFPAGPKRIHRKKTKEATEFFAEILKTESPTIAYLCNLLDTTDDEALFAHTFMTLIIYVFLAPNGSGIVKICYYSNLVDLSEVPQMDWCYFTLEMLLKYIKKYQLRKVHDTQKDIGGCKMLLVVCSVLLIPTHRLTLKNMYLYHFPFFFITNLLFHAYYFF
jgi:hypothetical protein